MDDIIWDAFNDELEKVADHLNPLWDVDMEESPEPSSPGKWKGVPDVEKDCPMSVSLRSKIAAPATRDTLQKIAKLRVGDIEEELGTFLGGADEAKVRHLIAKQRSKRPGMKHPWLTGIPTLGIWPAISKYQAKGKITRRMLRDHGKYRRTFNAKMDQLRSDAMAARQAKIDSDRANAPARAVSASALPLAMYLKHKKEERGQS